MTETKRLIVSLLAGVAAVWSGGAVLGQNRVNLSNSLDNNLRVGSGGVNRRAPARDYTGRFNDALVTGNAGGLARFRGTISYRAAGEFRGTSGAVTSPSFRFRQENLQYGVGGNPQVNLSGGNILYRSGSGVTAGQLRSGMPSGMVGSDKRILRDDMVSGSMIRGRLGTESMDLLAARPRIQTPEIYNTETGGLLRVDASPLMGLQTTRLGGEVGVSKSGGIEGGVIDPYRRVGEEGKVVKPRGTLDQEKARLSGDEEEMAANPFRFDDRVAGSSMYVADYLNRGMRDRVSDGAIGKRQTDANILTASVLYPRAWEKTAPGEDAYLDHLKRVRGADDPGLLKLRGVMGVGVAEEDEDQRWVGSLTGDVADGESYLEQLKRKLEEVGAKSEKAAAVASEEQKDAAFESLIGKLDYDLAPLVTLAGSSGTEYDTLMREAEEAMGAGKYFNAGTIYQRAGGLRPGHPSVLVGRVNAQIGAGVFASASLDLRRLLTNHPELVAARYREPLLPEAGRLMAVRHGLEPLLSSEVAQPGVLLLAYVAYQQGDEAMVGRALGALKVWYSEDPLITLLERIWLPHVFETP